MPVWLTSILATVGAVTGTISLCLLIRTALKDRAIVAVEAQMTERFGPQPAKSRLAFSLTVTNRGRRIARIVKAGIKPRIEELTKLGDAARPVREGKVEFLGSEFLIFEASENDAKVLEENESYTIDCDPVPQHIVDELLGGKALAFAKDSLGNRYTAVFAVPKPLPKSNPI